MHKLSRDDKLAIALHDFAAVTAEDFVPFDYCDGPNGIRGHQGASAFPSTLALAAAVLPARQRGCHGAADPVQLPSQTLNHWNLLFTNILLITIPMLIMFVFFNRQIGAA